VSLFAWSQSHIVSWLVFAGLWVWSVAKTAYRHCQTAGELHSQLLRNDGFMSAVALGVGLGSLTHRAGIPARPALVIHSYVKVT